MFNVFYQNISNLVYLYIFQFARTKHLGAMPPNRTVLLKSQKKTAKSFVAYVKKYLKEL